MTRAFLTSVSKRCRPLPIRPGRSSTTVSATPTGAKTRRSSARCNGVDSPSTAGPLSLSSDTIPAEHLLLVGQLARVLHEEARAAHELIGLLGQDALVAFGAVLLVRGLIVLGLVFDDKTLFQ